MGFLSSLFGKQKEKPSSAIESKQQNAADVFSGLRQQILQLRPESIHLTQVPEGPIAVLMEIGHPKAVVTLVVVFDGSISLYFSNGGGIIGAGGHESVRAAGTALLESAAEFSPDLEPTETFPLPARGEVRFYLVARGGVRTAAAPEIDLGQNRHQLSPLYYKGQDVITAIRLTKPPPNARSA